MKSILILKVCTALFLANVASSVYAVDAEMEKTQAVVVETITNHEKNYSIDYPKTWHKEELPPLDLVLFAPSKEGDAKIHANANIIAEKLDEPASLDTFYKESIDNIKKTLTDVKIEESGEMTLDGVPTKWVLFNQSMQGVHTKVLQYFLMADDRAFLITFSALTDDFAEYRPVFDKMTASFRFIKKPAPVAK